MEIAKQSAEAAERLAEANESLAISGQRGWLIVMTAQATPDHAPHQDKVIVRAHFQFKNVGNKPIAQLRLRHCKRILASDPKDFAGLETVFEATLAPNAEVLLKPIYECTPAEFSKIKSRETKLYFYGYAIYNGHLRAASGRRNGGGSSTETNWSRPRRGTGSGERLAAGRGTLGAAPSTHGNAYPPETATVAYPRNS